MSSNEVNIILGEMREGFKRVEGGISDLHKRVSHLAENGCALRPVHEREITELHQELIGLRRQPAGSNGNGDSFAWGKKLKAMGTPAIILAAIIGFAGGLCLIGYTMSKIHKNGDEAKKPAAEKVVSR